MGKEIRRGQDHASVLQRGRDESFTPFSFPLAHKMISHKKIGRELYSLVHARKGLEHEPLPIEQRLNKIRLAFVGSLADPI